MEEILKKLNELNELCQTIPNECKGNSCDEARKNRHKYITIKSGIGQIMFKLNKEEL